MLGAPVQMAFAVDDVMAAAQRWVAAGVGPFFVAEHITVRSARVRGEPGDFDHSSAFAHWGLLMVELICQHDGGPDPVIGDSGLHHVAHFVDDIGVAAEWLAANGALETLYAETTTGTPFAFHDARAERGHFIEIYEPTQRLVAFYELVREESMGWTGSDPIRRI